MSSNLLGLGTGAWSVSYLAYHFQYSLPSICASIFPFPLNFASAPVAIWVAVHFSNIVSIDSYGIPVIETDAGI